VNTVSMMIRLPGAQMLKDYRADRKTGSEITHL
jgi:hypothetical protein